MTDPFLSDIEHPSWADYVATNLMDALSQVPDTGDWHGALRAWCERTMTGKLHVNRTGKPFGEPGAAYVRRECVCGKSIEEHWCR